MPKDKTSNSEQVARFIETARDLGCNEDKERFEVALGKIARHKPTTKKVRPKKLSPKE
jgi:hypothetical protein